MQLGCDLTDRAAHSANRRITAKEALEADAGQRFPFTCRGAAFLDLDHQAQAMVPVPVRRDPATLLIDKDDLAVTDKIIEIAFQNEMTGDRRTDQFLADQANAPWAGQIGGFVF